MAVWVILVGRLDGDNHAEQYRQSMQHIARKFDAGRDNGRRLGDDSDDVLSVARRPLPAMPTSATRRPVRAA